MLEKRRLAAALLITSLTGLIFFQTPESGRIHFMVSRAADGMVLAGLLVIITSGLVRAAYKISFALKNLPLLFFTAAYSIVFTVEQIDILGNGNVSYVFRLSVQIARTLFLIYLCLEGRKDLAALIGSISAHPAVSIMLSFLIVIMAGTLILMLPFCAAEGVDISFTDALFTATSAVCVTGLIVVDTASAFSLAGKTVILALIQIGGLGIMIISYFAFFFMGRRLSFDAKRRLAFAISDDDMSGIRKTLQRIIFITFSIEGAGALLLFIGLGRHSGFGAGTAFSAVFHSISAFCNAGFSLYSDSLEGFKSDPAVILPVSLLIILGGLSFAVIINTAELLKKRGRGVRLNLNSRIVLSFTGIFLLSGMYLFYASEHRNSLLAYTPGTQLLSAFFQSVTLRTAGFNSVPFTSLTTATVVFMCFYMFTGAASGSTAGGIKINTLAVMAAYVKSVVTGSSKVTLFKYQLSQDRVLRSFLIFQYGVLAVFLGVLGLAATQQADLTDMVFEAVSAFGTVGLSTGLTPQLDTAGRIIIILLMFNGRLGPLTILATLTRKDTKGSVEYPQGDIAVG